MNTSSPNRRRYLYIFAALVVLAILGYGWLRPQPAPALATTSVMRANIENTVIASGTLEAVKLVSVGAQVSGRVESLKVQLGDVVKEGDLIAQIDSTTQSNAVKNAQAALNSARAQRAATLASHRQAELAFKRQQTMMASDATSRAEFEAAQAALDAANAQLKQVDAQIAQAETSLSTSEANLGYTRITAPMNGTVVAIVTKEGQTVNANQSAPTIVMLAQLDVMQVKAEVSEADVIKVKPGQKVYFTILGNPDKRYYATLKSVSPAPESVASDSLSATSSGSAIYYNALFEVPNPDGELRISMTAQVYIVLAEARDALVIPAAAIEHQRRTGKSTVMVVGSNDQPEPREVKVGINNNAEAQILSGLQEGEQVVLGQASSGLSETAQRMQSRGPRMF